MLLEPLSKEELKGWRELLTPADMKKTAFFAFALFISCFYLPFINQRELTVFYLLFAAGAVFATQRSFFSSVCTCLPGYLIYSFTGSAGYAAGYFALLVAVAAGSVLLAGINKKAEWAIAALLPLAAFLLGWLAGGSILWALLALLPVPAVLLAGILLRRCSPFVPSVIALAAVFALLIFAAGYAAFLAKGLSGNPLRYFSDFLHRLIPAKFEEIKELYAQAGLSESIAVIDTETIAVELINLLPGLFLALCAVAAFSARRLSHAALTAFGILPRVPFRLAAFTMSPVSAVIFLVSYLIGALAGSTTPTVSGMVAQNLAITLEPGLALMGYASLFGRKSARSCLSGIVAILLLITLFINAITGLALAAFVGAFSVLAARFFPSPEDKNKGEQ